MSLLLHISDTHFGTEQPPVVEALVALALRQRPDLVVLSGDITQRARSAQFRAARQFADRLGAPLLAVPGNHDIPLFNLWARAHRPYAGHAAAFSADLEPTHSSHGLLVLGVNTTRAHRHKDGEVSSAQIERVGERLALATPDQLRVVVVHQPVAVTEHEDLLNLLHGHDQATRCWAGAGADVVLAGHIHLPYVLELQGLGRPLWAVNAGTAVSGRVRGGAPNSVNLLRWQPAPGGGQCVVEQWDCRAGEGAFHQVAATTLRPVRA